VGISLRFENQNNLDFRLSTESYYIERAFKAN